MNARRKTEHLSPGLRTFEFSHLLLRSSLRVEKTEEGVVIRSAEPGLSPRTRRVVLHYLAKEGFIPDLPGVPSKDRESAVARIEWVTTALHDRRGGEAERGARRTAKFIICLFVFVCLIWLLQLAVLFLTRP